MQILLGQFETNRCVLVGSKGIKIRISIPMVGGYREKTIYEIGYEIVGCTKTEDGENWGIVCPANAQKKRRDG